MQLSVDTAIHNVENKLTQVSPYPVVGTVAGVAKVLMGTVQLIVAVVGGILALLPSIINWELSYLQYSWSHIKQGFGNIIEGTAEAIPIVQTGLYFVRKRANVSRLQGNSLENISKMTKEEMDIICNCPIVNNRNDYIKCMLIFAIRADKFSDGDVDMAFHDMIPYFQRFGALKQFVHDDIAAGRRNEENTLLHEILKCEFLTPKAKGSAFGFILRDGHDYLRDYYGDRSLGPVNQWGNRPTNFDRVEWGDSLKKIFDTFSTDQKQAFFASSSDIAARLRSFTGI